MRKGKSVLILIMLLALSIVFLGCVDGEESSSLEAVNNAYITIDINPSVEIITNDEGLVEQVNALNDDAILLLVDVDFKGQSVDITLDAILELAIDLGYLDFSLENAILITVGTQGLDETSELETKVSKRVKDFVDKRKMNVDVLKASLEANEDIKELAEEYGISIGKVKLIYQAISADNSLTFDDASQMSIRSLNQIIKENRDEVREFYSEEVRGKYHELKAQNKIDFQLAVIKLYNEKIQAANDEIFFELLENSTVEIDEIKALFQEFYEAIIAANLPDDEFDDEEISLQIEELEKELNELKAELVELLSQVQEIKDDLLEEDLSSLYQEIKESSKKQRDIINQMNELSKSLRARFKKGQEALDFGRYFQDKNLMKVYREIKDLYQEKFEELGINLDDLISLFEADVEAEIEELKEMMEAEIDNFKEQLKVDSKAIKEQIREEKKILKEAWKR